MSLLLRGNDVRKQQPDEPSQMTPCGADDDREQAGQEDHPSTTGSLRADDAVTGGEGFDGVFGLFQAAAGLFAVAFDRGDQLVAFEHFENLRLEGTFLRRRSSGRGGRARRDRRPVAAERRSTFRAIRCVRRSRTVTERAGGHGRGLSGDDQHQQTLPGSRSDFNTGVVRSQPALFNVAFSTIRHSRECGNPGAGGKRVDVCVSRDARWIPAFAGMT